MFTTISVDRTVAGRHRATGIDRCLARLAAALFFVGAALPSSAQTSSVSSMPSNERGYRASLQHWVGRNVRELIAEWGKPREVYDHSRTPNKTYLWMRNEGEMEYQGERLPASCATRFFVSPAGEIIRFSYDGNSCKAPDHSIYASVPTFWLTGSGRVEDATTRQTFLVVEFVGADLLAVPGCGPALRGTAVAAHCIGTELPARPMKLRLRGSHRTDTLEQESARRAAGTFLVVEGEVDFVPIADRKYVVTGELAPGRSAVWIEDTVTKQPATAVIRVNE
jgi:hypothetical protein